MIQGLDEGILSMKVGGLRRLYIPGPVSTMNIATRHRKTETGDVNNMAKLLLVKIPEQDGDGFSFLD